MMLQDTRPFCWICHRPKSTCFCETLKPFTTAKARFCLLMHPHEARQRTGTGRITHLLLRNSDLFVGIDFTQDERIAALLTDPNLVPMILFPCPVATALVGAVNKAKADGRMPLIFVLDGTWYTAQRILAKSPNLSALPCVSFVSSRRSRFRFKKQPKEHCLSTIEAVDECIAIIEPENIERICLMQAFDTFVEKQLSFIQ
ncbi:MAG: DTW domain-containing protein [Parachlamydiaceae bacterium]|nr:DTW domain-containing protein [Parachlamydiaceae bacterium]